MANGEIVGGDETPPPPMWIYEQRQPAVEQLHAFISQAPSPTRRKEALSLPFVPEPAWIGAGQPAPADLEPITLQDPRSVMPSTMVGQPADPSQVFMDKREPIENYFEQLSKEQYLGNLQPPQVDKVDVVDVDRFPEGFPRAEGSWPPRPRSRSSTPTPPAAPRQAQQPPQHQSPQAQQRQSPQSQQRPPLQATQANTGADTSRSRSPAPTTITAEMVQKALDKRSPRLQSPTNLASPQRSLGSSMPPKVAASPLTLPAAAPTTEPVFPLEFPGLLEFQPGPGTGLRRPSQTSTSSWRMSAIKDAFHLEGEGMAKIEEKLLAEFVGTYFLALTVNIAFTGGRPDAAVSIGLMLAVQTFCFGSVSGACLNPAVTLAVLLAGRGKLNPKNCGLYIGVQFLGGIFGALFAFAATRKTMYFDYVDNTTGNGWAAFFLELLYTSALCSSVLTAATSDDTPNHYFGFAIGCTALASIMSCGQLVQGSFNPAVAFGSNMANAMNSGKKGGPSFVCWLLYVLVPFLGSCLSVCIFKMTRGREYLRSLPKASSAYSDHAEPKE